MKYFILNMADAVDGLGIASSEYYFTSKKPNNEKKWTTPVLFEGTFEECFKEKQKMVRIAKNS